MGLGFLGTYRPRLDDKGRLFLPAKFRKDLEAGIVMTVGHERCVYVFTNERYTALRQEIDTRPGSGPDERLFSRMILGGAYDAVPDSTGRVSVPSDLREWANLDRECAVVGVSDRLEIWDLPAWEAYRAEQAGLFAGGSTP